MQYRKAVAQKMNIDSHMTDDIIFNKIAAAFQLPSGYSKDELLSVLAEAFRLKSAEIENQKLISGNLEKQISFLEEKIGNLNNECAEYRNRLQELRNSTQPMMEQFQQIKDENKGLKAANEELLRQNMHLTEQVSKMKTELFGTSSEKMEHLLEQVLDDEEDEDPLSEDADSEKEAVQNKEKSTKDSGNRRRKEKGFRDRNLKNLPVQTVYEYDIDRLNKQYGEGNWRFVNWKGHRTVEFIRAASYVKVVYTPVISYGLEHSMETVYYEGSLFPKSLASASLLANIITDKFCMYIPMYRMENDINRYGFSLSRQTISNWIIKAAEFFFMPVYLYLQSLLVMYPYQQCDETTWRVIRDQRGPGRKSYFWAHRSSELQKEGPPIIYYELEKTRSGRHLEKYFQKIFPESSVKIRLTSDAFSAYPALENNHSENIESCGCFSHARRRSANALRIIKGKKTKAELESLPEYIFVDKISAIYAEENKLKEMSASDRYMYRQKVVKPKVDEFFDYIKTLDPADPTYSDTFKNALEYALNQEKYLRRFLDDGNIPIDDNACERSIKSLVMLRKNCLFSNTFRGGTACGIIMTLIETAKANGADPYWYIQYLLEKMPPRYYSGRASDNPEQMVPWSDEYRCYEKEQQLKILDRCVPAGNDKPRTPRKKDLIVITDQVAGNHSDVFS